MLLDEYFAKLKQCYALTIFEIESKPAQKILFLTKNFLRETTEYPAEAQTIIISSAVRFQKLL